MAGNRNLDRAKKVKNDEFWTKIGDVEKECRNYRDQFKDKIVFCNCDDPEYSNFWRYFYLNFDYFGLKKLISTHYEIEKSSYKLEYDGKKIKKTPLELNGDFNSPECVEILKSVDIAITNPPFSLLRLYVNLLININEKTNLKFLIISSQNAITYKEIFPLLKENKMWLGYNSGSFEFIVPEAYTTGNLFYDSEGNKCTKLGNIIWFTNLETTKRHEDLILYKKYNKREYPKYDNYDAINVDKIVDIPMDYNGIMGVPITFMLKHNPEQFEIVGNLGSYAPDGYSLASAIYINGKKKFKRIAIKRKKIR